MGDYISFRSPLKFNKFTYLFEGDDHVQISFAISSSLTIYRRS